MRLLQYVEFARAGYIDMSADVVTLREMGSTALLDAQRTWGQVAAKVAMERAIEIAARQGISMVALVNSPHIGRLGEYVVMAAERDMIGTAYVNSQTGGDGSVAPWGGIEGRFTPTPLAFAAPSGLDWPVLVDITASVMPEGKVRDHFFRGAQLPEGVIIDADGNPTRDPTDFYGPPAGGLLPLGGPVGHKGYALGVMIEMLAGGLSGAGYVSEAAVTHGNGVLFQVMNIAAFEDIDNFKRRTRSSLPMLNQRGRAPASMKCYSRASRNIAVRSSVGAMASSCRSDCGGPARSWRRNSAWTREEYEPCAFVETQSLSRLTRSRKPVSVWRRPAATRWKCGRRISLAVVVPRC